MAGSPDTSRLNGSVLRFSRSSRLVHWTHAAPFLLLLLTGLSLFIPTVKAVHIDGYRLVPLAHVVVGIAFILSPLVLFVRLRRNRSVGRDLHALFTLRPEDAGWFRYAFALTLGTKASAPPVAKFNAGQKANAAATVILTLGLMLTGAVLAVNFFTKQIFSAAFVERIFPLHDLFMIFALPIVLVHIYLAIFNPSTRESLNGILGGSVRRRWAREHHALWLDQVESDPSER
jgi:formate dehydrogenase subunit gamma